ncbi:MAG: DUF2914 domain-containing protein [Pseudomonadota bacterium]
MELHELSKRKLMFKMALIINCLIPVTAFSDDEIKSPVPDAIVSRAQFTTGISNREPIDELVKVENSITSLFYFTELRNLDGRKVSHRWEHNGQVISEVSFMVEGPRWRVFSKKTLNPSMLGKWTVFVIDESGWPIHASIFKYTSDE